MNFEQLQAIVELSGYFLTKKGIRQSRKQRLSNPRWNFTVADEHGKVVFFQTRMSVNAAVPRVVKFLCVAAEVNE